MGKYDDFVAALGRAGVPKGTIDDFIKKFSKNQIKKGLTQSGIIKPKFLKEIKDFLGADSSSFKALSNQNDQIVQRAIVTLRNSGKYSDAFDANGKFIFDPDSLGHKGIARIFGKSTDEIARMADDVDVQNAAKTKKNDLIKLGISGSLVTGVIFLMLLTGKKNPVEAIAEALKESAKAAAEAAKETGGFVFKNLFSGMDGIFNVSALFLFCSSIGIVLWLVISVVLKK